MSRSKGNMASLQRILLVAALHLAICTAGPVGPLPNVTSSDLGLAEGSCSVGATTYAPGATVPGSGPCERCSCAGGEVRCARDRCDPRPGCKALHRPDQCCPTYQCDCEQDGRVYANGEKLVDPADPCRVCYCQGGEVVCRRIACFLRDDCRPRLVPGRCCPEYDNCPLRGVTSLPGVSSPIPSVSSIEETSVNSAPAPLKEPIKQEITIKEITPVSEIPIKTDVKIKEIISPSDTEAVEYSSSKSPLIPREATSEQAANADVSSGIPDAKVSSPLDLAATDLSTMSIVSPSVANTEAEDKSKIILPPRENSASDVYASKVPNIIPLMGVPVTSPTPVTTRAPIIEEEEAPLDNPAFPPIPDDLSVMGNHEDDQNIENEQPSDHDVVSATSKPVTTPAPEYKDTATTSSSSIVGIDSSATERSIESTSDTIKDILVSTQSAASSESTMLDLRSVIPKEILDVPSLISNESTGELLDATESPKKGISEERNNFSEASTESDKTGNIEVNKELSTSISSSEAATTVTEKVDDSTENVKQFNLKDEAFSSTANLGEITSQTEFSSIPIETSDQNPHGIVDRDESDKVFLSTTVSPVFPSLPTKHTSESEVITLLAEVPAIKDDRSYEYVETTEFIVSPYYSEESATEAVELIKISPNAQESSSIILRPKAAENSNVLNDLINLVGDVASMPDHTDNSEYQTLAPAALNSNSEELIPVNAGYKSKNNNWNLNSITEQPHKSKNSGAVNKQRVVEIEDEESDTITDSPPPNDKVEPTTRRPIIDNVSDDANNKTDKSNKKDIEIITQSYVPTINKRPTKVILQEESDASEKPVPSGAPAEAPRPSEISTSLKTTPAPKAVERSPAVTDEVSDRTTDASIASE
ncbi:putative GPI-anchored protein pfl2 [Aricia agestis]|uniref:putative GPI-anchored protein pfl2 n=1 Tax=Aricia agestis TaxID=91739 RepID=UPI001C201E97|nr:putative GPI-anchored protein pfl2 [Aricia agestis]